MPFSSIMPAKVATAVSIIPNSSSRKSGAIKANSTATLPLVPRLLDFPKSFRLILLRPDDLGCDRDCLQPDRHRTRQSASVAVRKEGATNESCRAPFQRHGRQSRPGRGRLCLSVDDRGGVHYLACTSPAGAKALD